MRLFVLIQFYFVTFFVSSQNNPIFSGGNSTDQLKTCYIATSSVTQTVGVSFGNTGGGLSEDCHLQNNALFSNIIFEGGNGSGIDQTCYEQNDFIANNTVFLGGSFSGNSKDCFIQDDLIASNSIFFGSDNSGFEFTCYEQTLPIFNNHVFEGGEQLALFVDCTEDFALPSPLPVELISFSHSCKEEKSVLSWITASEINNWYFEIQISFDGVDFQSVAEIQGNGTTSEKNTYNWLAEEPIRGIHYYRIKQVDFNGDLEYFPIISANCNSNSDLVVKLFPNPTSNHFNIRITNPYPSETITLHMRDAGGKIIHYEELMLTHGDNIFPQYTTNLAPGVYYIVIQLSNGKLIHRKIVIAK